MDILKRKRFLGVSLLVLMFTFLTCSCIHAQEGMKQQTNIKNLEQMKILLNEGLEYLNVSAFPQAKSKFEEALKIAPPEMAGEIKELIARVSEASVKKEVSSEVVKELVTKGEEEAKKISELQQNIIQFEKEQKKITYMNQGKSYYDMGEYEKAIGEFNKVLAMNPQDKDALSSIEKTNSAIEKAKEMEARSIQDSWSNAKSFANSKEYDNAIKEIEKILAANPSDVAALEYMKEMKSLKAESDEYRKLEDMVEKGKQYFSDREYDKAIQIWKQVLLEKEGFPGAEVLISQAKFAQAKGEQKVVDEKYKSEREQRMVEVDRAFVPIIGGKTEIKKEEIVEDPDAISIEAMKNTIKEKKVTLEFTDADLRSVILFLSRQANVNMMIDESIFQTGLTTGAIGEQPMGGGMPTVGGGMGAPGAFPGAIPGEGGIAAAVPVNTYSVTASLRDISVKDALDLILRSRGLGYEIYPNVIWISSQDRIANVPMEAIETRIFDLQFGGPFRGQLRPQPLQLETITFGESTNSGSSE